MTTVRFKTLKEISNREGWPCTQITEPGTFLIPTYNLISGKYGIEAYRNSDIYVTTISHARLVLNKYLLVSEDEVVHGGLTYNDYNVVDEVIDPFGLDRGRRLISDNGLLDSTELRMSSDPPEVFGDAIWINGQTTPEPFFGHWLHENLAKVIAVERAGISHGTILIRDSVPRRFLDWIGLISKGNWTYKRIDAAKCPVFENIVIPTAVNYRSRFGGALCVWAEGMNELRHRARLKSLPPEKPSRVRHRPRALFIRRTSPWRNLINQDEIKSVFAKYFDVEEVQFEAMPPDAQVSAVRGFDLIFGPSGSSMPVVMFADSGTVVCEFFNPRNEGKWAAKVYCDLYGLPHVRVNGSAVGENLGPTPADSNYYVPRTEADKVASKIIHHIGRSMAQTNIHDFGGKSPRILSPFSMHNAQQIG
jgi:hypothetical protein